MVGSKERASDADVSRARHPQTRGRFHAKSDADGPLPAHICTVSRRADQFVACAQLRNTVIVS